MIEYQRWPEALAQHYRDAGYWIDRPLSRLLSEQAEKSPQALALISGDRRYRYADLDALSDRLAHALRRRGLRSGDTALVQLPNVAEFYIVFFALLKIGVAPVNALFSHQRLELLSYARQLQPRMLIGASSHRLFADEAFISELRSISPRLREVFMLGANVHTQDLADLFLEEPPATPLQASAADEVAFFQLSGGSTGTPKLIPRTHNDYDYSVRRSAEICALSAETRYLCALPAAHNFPLSSPGALGVFHAGGCVVLATDPEALRCFELIAQHQVNMAALVPSAVALWLQAAPGRREQLQSLKLLQVGGASFAESLARRVPQELGCQLQQVFGMAEGLVNYTRLDDGEARIYRTQGAPMSSADEVRVLDEQGRELPDGEVGLLSTRGPYTFRGYYRAPEHNARVFDTEGFYCSGDLVQRNADGYLKVVGRVKDQINRGGEKIAAEEVEAVLLQHPAIVQAAVVSVPDELLGEKSCACLVVTDARLRAVDVRKWLRAQGLADYKLPDRVQLLDRLPLTAVGKTDKPRLRNQLLTPAELTS